MSATGEHSAQYVAQDKSAQLWIAMFVTWGLATITMALRFYCKKLTSQKMGLDDYFIIVSYTVGLTAFPILIPWAIHGVGRHIETVNVNDVILILKLLTPGEIIYGISLGFTKYSILAFYWKFFGTTSMRHVIRITGVVVTCWALCLIILSAVSCVPLKKLWNPWLPGHCINLKNFYIGVAIINICTDTAMLLMPCPYVWQLHMNKERKIAVVGTFLVGGFIVLVSVIRLIVLINLDLTDITWGCLGLGVWTAVELWIAILCACLPTLRPIVNLISRKPANWTEISRNENNGYAGGINTITKHTITSRTVQRNNWPRGKQGDDDDKLVEGDEESFEQRGITLHTSIKGGHSHETFEKELDVPLTPMDFSSNLAK